MEGKELWSAVKAAPGGVRSFCEVCNKDLESRLDTLRDHGKSKGHVNRMNNLNANKRMTAFITPKAGVYIVHFDNSPPPPHRQEGGRRVAEDRTKFIAHKMDF